MQLTVFGCFVHRLEKIGEPRHAVDEGVSAAEHGVLIHTSQVTLRKQSTTHHRHDHEYESGRLQLSAESRVHFRSEARKERFAAAQPLLGGDRYMAQWPRCRQRPD